MRGGIKVSNTSPSGDPALAAALSGRGLDGRLGFSRFDHSANETLPHDRSHLLVGLQPDQVPQFIRIGLQIVQEFLPVVVGVGVTPAASSSVGGTSTRLTSS